MFLGDRWQNTLNRGIHPWMLGETRWGGRQWLVFCPLEVISCTWNATFQKPTTKQFISSRKRMSRNSDADKPVRLKPFLFYTEPFGPYHASCLLGKFCYWSLPVQIQNQGQLLFQWHWGDGEHKMYLGPCLLILQLRLLCSASECEGTDTLLLLPYCRLLLPDCSVHLQESDDQQEVNFEQSSRNKSLVQVVRSIKNESMSDELEEIVSQFDAQTRFRLF